MIVLHAGFLGDQLLLWGETPPERAVRASKRRAGIAQTPAHGNIFPYDAGVEGLQTALQAAGLGLYLKGDKSRVRYVTAWLPTVDGAPVASSPLVAELPPSMGQSALASWTVSAYRLDWNESLGLLCACLNERLLAPGVVVGQDLAFWSKAMQFAGALATRERMLPGLIERGGEWRACWTPLFRGADAERLARLSRAMPAAGRALSEAAPAPPDVPPQSVLSDFLGGMVDYLVRAAMQDRPTDDAARKVRKTAQPAFDSLHDQWLQALGSPGGRVVAGLAELTGLAAQIREWQRRVAVSSSAPYQLCFRLEEPRDEDPEGVAQPAGAIGGQWYVRYLLQDVQDPSLLVPAVDAWTAKGQKARLLERPGFNVREFLLSALGQACGICPRIEGSLAAKAPEGYQVDAAGAHEFLTENALALEQAEFGVMLPAWWTRKGTKLRLAARASVKSPAMQGGGKLSLEQIVQFEWEVALGDEALSFQELQALAKLKAPLVKVRGQWVQMSAEEIQAALDFWKKKAAKATAREVIQMALGATQPAGPMEFDGLSATGWVADLLDQLEGRAQFEELETPDGFQGALRPYQVRGYSWLGFLRRWGLGACLADDMGLGKTIQTLALIERDWESNGKRPVLLICPTSVVGNWQKEAARFTPELPVMVHHGLTRARGEAFKDAAGKSAIVVSSYSLLHRDFEVLKEIPWAGVILDEAQNVKNPETKQSKAARSLKADYRVALTGTPVENNVGDLWSIMEFLNPGLLGTQADFRRTFFVPIQTVHDPEAAKGLKRLAGPFILRRLKTDTSIISDLPEKMEMKVFCTLTKEQASLYTAVVKETEETLKAAEGIQRRGLILATLSKLKQVCNHPAQFLGDNSAVPGRSGKLARLTEMLEEIVAVGDRALVFSQFAEMGEIMRRHLQETFGQEVLFLHGAVPKAKRDRMVERFQGEDGPSVFILSVKAGGTGLNLTRANHVFHFDRWWNPAVENQATDRAFRIGQTKSVQVHKFLCLGTLEEKIDEMIEGKKEVAEQVVGSGEGWLTELSTSELKKIFALRKDAIGE